MIIKPRSLLAGLRSHIPAMTHFRDMGGSTLDARYCYTVWMRHLVKLAEAGLEQVPNVVAEIGPGGSLGLTIAALLSGAQRSLALDAVPHADASKNIRVFDDMVRLFRERTPIPDAQEFPNVRPRLKDYAFPHALLPTGLLERTLAEERLGFVRRAIAANNDPLLYIAPWDNSAAISSGSVALIISQAAMEHVDDAANTYGEMARWLAPGGMMSHVIDYSCHGISRYWNGHWACGPRYWKLVRGKRPFFINRLPHSEHLRMHTQNNLSILIEERREDDRGLPASRLASPYCHLKGPDLTTSGSLIISRKQEMGQA